MVSPAKPRSPVSGPSSTDPTALVRAMPVGRLGEGTR
jgi:hypothetical protein